MAAEGAEVSSFGDPNPLTPGLDLSAFLLPPPASRIEPSPAQSNSTLLSPTLLWRTMLYLTQKFSEVTCHLPAEAARFYPNQEHFVSLATPFIIPGDPHSPPCLMIGGLGSP